MAINKHIPNSVTLLNLLAGSVAVIFAINGWQLFAVALIFAAAVFDFFDGFLARLLKAYSPLGKELDSLADLVSFGLAPSLLLYFRYNQVLAPYISSSQNSLFLEAATFTPLVITLASALRLAKFNNDENQKENFIGLPTPANALLIASITAYTTYSTHLDQFISNPVTIPLFSLIMSYLLISKLPMFSMKMKSLAFKGNESRFIFLLLIAVTGVICIVATAPFTLWVSTIFIIYILLNLSLIFCKN